MALDEPKDSDEVFDFDGDIKFVMDKQLLDSAKPVTVDISYMGFTVDSSLPTGGSCGSGCGSSGSGGCGSEGSCCS